MAEQFSTLAEEIINYQKKNDMPDTALAFNLHISVERLHNIKSMESEPTPDEKKDDRIVGKVVRVRNQAVRSWSISLL
ncbi:LBP_cg2779 family protein [Lentilactobacillus kisonensis]|uniref:LBP_cg2779 family protein n=1 Tax=Lentilactobacillus kisonensis TaxID=481722 RepID=UPI000A784FDB|nr:LBP_cg2779 family protein [Lentilactobacillus kisonensis]